jgi:hypothetical protein
MKPIVLATALVAFLAGPALAASKPTHNMRHEQHFKNANASVMARDPIGVYVDGQEIGRDPDANVRSAIQRDYYTQQGN